MSKAAPFSRVREAREAIAAKALELFEGYMKMIKKAEDADQFEVASKGYQFLIEHMPKDEEGRTLIDPSIDKGPTGKVGPVGPQIQIGIALTTPKALPPVEVIDVTDETSN
jgi:hypothetical protein